MNRSVLCTIFKNTLSKSGVRLISSVTASITKIHRARYYKTYPTLLVFPDGSTVNIRHHEPRAIIKLPVNLELLTDDQRRLRLEKRKPKEKVKVVEEKLIEFDPTKYVKKIRKK